MENEKSQAILKQVLAAKKILLSCHPHPDADIVGSVLAMTMAVKQLGKEVVAISGDSIYEKKFEMLPGIEMIEKKSVGEIDLGEFDLMLIVDASSLSQISRSEGFSLPSHLKRVVIDHHATNNLTGEVVWIETQRSSTCEMVYELLSSWPVRITEEMALVMFLGIYADTGGLRYKNTSSRTLAVASELVKIYPKYHDYIFAWENSKKAVEIEMMGVAINHLQKYMNEKLVLTAVPYEEIQKRGLNRDEAAEGLMADSLRAVEGWMVVGSLVEVEEGVVIASFRTRDQEKYDVSLLAKSVGEGGGGHKAAAGTTIKKNVKEAVEEVVGRAMELYSGL